MALILALLVAHGRLGHERAVAVRDGVLAGVPPGAAAEHDRLHQRVAAEPVGAVHRDARALAGGVQAGQDRLAVDVGVDSAHVVVGAGADRDRLLDRIDARVVDRELARPGQPRADLLRAEVREVEQHAAVDAAPLLDLLPLGARDDVARRELHRDRRRLGHEAVAAGVAQVAALAAAALGDQHAVRAQRRRMELHELHVLQRHARPPGHRHAVGRARVRVRRAVVHAPHAAGREDRVARGDAVQPAAHEIPRDDARCSGRPRRRG